MSVRTWLAVLIGVLAGAVPTGAASRHLYDTVETGSLNAVWSGSDKCAPVSSSYDGVAVINGTYQMRCNWNGEDGSAPFGHSHTEQVISSGTIPFTSEFFIRLKYRTDANMDHRQGSKFMRVSFEGGQEFILACEYQDGAGAIWWIGDGLPGSDWLDGAACGGHTTPQTMEIYVLKGTSGTVKIWIGDTLYHTSTGNSSTMVLSINMLSNWSLNPGWEHDTLNTVYVDDFELWTDNNSGTASTSGTMANGDITTTGGGGGGSPTPTNAPRKLRVRGEDLAAFALVPFWFVRRLRRLR